VFLSTPGTVCTGFVQQRDQPISGRQAWWFPARNATIVMFFGSLLESTVWQNEAVVGVLFGFTGRQSVLFGLKYSFHLKAVVPHLVAIRWPWFPGSPFALALWPINRR
jgi:hypothetical protein